MPIRDDDAIFETLENLHEEPVLATLKRRLEGAERRGACSCKRCLTDMVAFALNALPPRYVADKFNKFPDDEAAEERSQDEIDRAVDRAIDRVSARPHHE